VAYRYDLSYPDEGGWEPCLLPCNHCGYPEPPDLGPILVFDHDWPEDDGWLSGYRLLACPHCELTSYGKVLT
jgi:hypothetical protein